MKIRPLFRWMPTVFVLWILGVLYALGGGWSIWFATQAAHGHIHFSMVGADPRRVVRWFVRGAVEDILIAAFFILGWYFMRRRDYGALALGALSVLAGAFIIFYRSMYWISREASPDYWCEAILELPLLVYAIVYACHEMRKSAT